MKAFIKAHIPKRFMVYFNSHPEAWKMVKFALVMSIGSQVELYLYYFLSFVVFRSMDNEPFQFLFIKLDGLGSLWAMAISTVVGSSIAFFLNRRHTFHANNNPFLGLLMLLFVVGCNVIIATTTGTFFLSIFQTFQLDLLGRLLAKPMATFCVTVFNYPINRFLLHRKK